MLVNSFNLSQSFNYTHYLFDKKRFLFTDPALYLVVLSFYGVRHLSSQQMLWSRQKSHDSAVLYPA